MNVVPSIPRRSPFTWGTWPVRMHGDRLFGTISADGQHPRVSALVCDRERVVAISLVGYDTSVSAVLATLWYREQVTFAPADRVRWDGPRALRRRIEPYRQFSIQLAGTKEMQSIAIPTSANIAEGLLHPADLPRPPKRQEQANGRVTSSSPPSEPEADRSRFVLGNWDEEAPHMRSFLGTLYGMRVLFLQRHDEHPEWPAVWARELWTRGSVRALISPIRDAVGVKAWAISGDLRAWGTLIGDGTRTGWLPWRTTAPPEASRS